MSGRYDSFDILRIVAAFFVVFRHSFAITNGTAPGDSVLGRVGLDWGQLGLVIFFAVSGFLVTRSWTLDPSPRDFVTKRVLRIWPGFVVMLLVVTVGLGPLVTDAHVWSYFHDGETVGYAVHNVFMAPIRFRLPGVFVHNPDPSVNVSLWTLPYEVLAYCGVLAAGIVGVLRRAYVVVVGFLGLALLFQVGVANNVHDLNLWSRQFNGMNAYDLVRLLVPFVAGSLIWLFRRWVPTRRMGATVAAAGIVAAVALHVHLAAYVLVPYLAIYLGTRPSAFGRRVHRLGDPSYGIYIYSFPIQQVLVQTSWVGPHAWLVLVGSSLVSTAVAYASWHFIERPAMRLQRRRPPHGASQGRGGTSSVA